MVEVNSISPKVSADFNQREDEHPPLKRSHSVFRNIISGNFMSTGFSKKLRNFPPPFFSKCNVMKFLNIKKQHSFVKDQLN